MKGRDDVSGWVKIHRKIRDNWIWDKPEYLKAWLDLIFKANYEDKRVLFDGEVNNLKRGQFITSIRKLSDEWGWSKDRVLNFLRLLEKDEMIHRESNRKRTLITIENYSFYQVCQDTDSYSNQDSNQDTDSPQRRNKEEKKNNTTDEIEDKLTHDFDTIYKNYPRQVGKTKAYKKYCDWVTKGRVVNKKRIKLTNRQIWEAVKKYSEENKDTDIKFIKQFDTFLGDSLLDYIDFEDKG